MEGEKARAGARARARTRARARAEADDNDESLASSSRRSLADRPGRPLAAPIQ
jgi:hypothetical protein